MLVYNVTIKLHPAIEDAWIQWMKREHGPEMLASGQFNDWKLFRLLDQDESEGITFVVQYFTDEAEKYERYVQEYATVMQRKSFSKWGDQFIAFRTVMQVVH